MIFDQVYIKKEKYIELRISLIEYIIKYNFVIYLFDVINVGILLDRFGQT
jgi:hypothetical protein